MKRNVTRLIGVGNIVIDTVYHLDGGEMERRGFTAGAFAHLSRRELEQRLSELRPAMEQFGGSAFNKAMVASRLGVPVRVVGAAGRDRSLGGGEFEDATVPVRREWALGAHLVDPDGAWSVAMAPESFDDFDAIDAEAALSVPALDAASGKRSPIVTVEVYLVNNLPWLESVIDAAGRKGIAVHFDLGAPPLIRGRRDDLVRLISRGVQFLSATEGELNALLGEGISEETSRETLDLQVLTVKRGARGVTVIDDSGRFDAPGSGSEVAPPWSIGCGDVLDGALLTVLAESDASMTAEKVAAAAALAGSCCRSPLAKVDSRSIAEFRRKAIE